MSGVVTAVVGSAVIGGIVASKSASSAAKASAAGSEAAAAATIESTAMQVDEIARQFNYQQQILLPQIQQQYMASQAYSDLLGLGDNMTPAQATLTGGTAGQPASAGGTPGGAPGMAQAGAPPGGWNFQSWQAAMQAQNAPPAPAGQLAPSPPPPGSTTFQEGDRGEFRDPRLDPTRLADIQNLPAQIQNTLLAGTDQVDDPLAQYIAANQIGAESVEQDLRFRHAKDVTNAGPTLEGDIGYQDVAGRRISEGAAGVDVYGEEFEASPGYAFQVEEMNRALDRRSSAGGNYGGRAIMEAQRRAQGLAKGDYYNWAAGRTQDLTRLSAAEAADEARLDTQTGSYLARRQSDIGREDTALTQFEGQRTADIQRGDVAFQDYNRRLEGDVTRMDAVTAETDRLQGVDIQRGDQQYYNYLANVGAMAGMGNPAGMAVQSSQAAGGAVAGAYGQQGTSLSNIYTQQGTDQANIELGRGANINNAIQSGVGNYLTYQAMQGPQQASAWNPTPTVPGYSTNPNPTLTQPAWQNLA